MPRGKRNQSPPAEGEAVKTDGRKVWSKERAEKHRIDRALLAIERVDTSILNQQIEHHEQEAARLRRIRNTILALQGKAPANGRPQDQGRPAENGRDEGASRPVSALDQAQDQRAAVKKYLEYSGASTAAAIAVGTDLPLPIVRACLNSAKGQLYHHDRHSDTWRINLVTKED